MTDYVWDGPNELVDMLMPILDLHPDPKNARVHNVRDLSAPAALATKHVTASVTLITTIGFYLR